MVLGIDPRALHRLGKCSTIEPYLQSLSWPTLGDIKSENFVVVELMSQKKCILNNFIAVAFQKSDALNLSF
jgi:hypothetical protein